MFRNYAKRRPVASVTYPVIGYGDGLVVSLTFDNVSGILTSVSWVNPSGVSRTVTAQLPNGSRTFTATITGTSGSVAAPTQTNRRLTYAKGTGSGDNDPTAWVPQFNATVG